MGNQTSVNISQTDPQLQKKTETQGLFGNEENVTIVWYDSCSTPNLSKDDERYREEKLRQVTTDVFFYDDEAELLQYVNSVTDKYLFLILPLSVNMKELLTSIHGVEPIDKIFLYDMCTGEAGATELTRKFSKIVGLYHHLEELIDAVQEKITIHGQQSAMFHLYDEDKQAATRDLTKESGSFLFFQLFHYMTMNTRNTDELKQQMIEKCRIYYDGHKKELQEISHFEQTYQAQDAIHWYTQDTFVYKLVNRALRTEDIEALSTFQFFITDLSLSLKENFYTMKEDATGRTSFTVYRGQRLSTDELRSLQDSVGKVISTNGYLSTSRSREVAVMFAANVLMKIEMDMNLETVVCADVAQQSQIPDEQEVLFDISAVFEVIGFAEERKYPLDDTDYSTVLVIKMKATDKGSTIAREYIEYQKQRVNQSESSLMFGCLLVDMGQYHKSKQYFERILEMHPNDEKVACTYSNLARTYRLKGEYIRSMEYYQRAYQMHVNVRPQRFLSAARILNGLALVYSEQQNHATALEKLMLALEMYKKHGKDDEEYAGILNNIGSIYYSLDQIDQAKKYFEKMNRINDKLLPLDHPNRAKALINMGNIYYKQKDYETSLEYYLKGLQIKDKVLPVEHQDRISCLNSTGLVYYQLTNYQKAYEYFHKAMIMIEKTMSHPSNHYLFNDIKKHIQLVSEKIDVTAIGDAEVESTSTIKKLVKKTASKFKWLDSSFQRQRREESRRRR